RGRGIEYDLRLQEREAPGHDEYGSHGREQSLPALALASDLLKERMNSRPEMSLSAEDDASNNLLGGNRWIAFLSGIAPRQETIALYILENQTMRAQSSWCFGDHDISDSQASRCHTFNL